MPSAITPAAAKMRLIEVIRRRSYGTGVEIAAQGGDANLTPGRVLSTLNAGTTSPTTDTYGCYQGTSMATPHVAGVAALVKAAQPGLTPAALTALLRSTVTPGRWRGSIGLSAASHAAV